MHTTRPLMNAASEPRLALAHARRALRAALAAAGAAAALSPGLAGADLDISPPLPNVMLLVDTSGSMERMIDGNLPATAGAACTPGTPMPKNLWNRWATLVQVLVGDIQNFSCYALDRGSSAFKSEYSWLGVKPYDYRYHLPFHRLVSNDCTAGPGTAASTWFDWPAGAINYHRYDDAASTCQTPFQVSGTGILDTFRNQIRFGMMTLDSWQGAGTGASGANTDAVSGMQGPMNVGAGGLWSYYRDWNSGGSPATGSLPNCQFPITYEVGARNPAAPPWEGRLIGFGHFDASLAEMQATNAQIQESLLAMRPYGRTPLGAILKDAEDFLVYDQFPDPNNPGKFLGTNQDPYFLGGCRPTFLILLSDGEGEPELRPDCESVNGCPFAEPDVVASELAALSPQPVYTYVIGFGVPHKANVDCEDLVATDFASGGVCESPTPAMQSCCALAKIAVAGGTTHAFFADDVSGLSQAFSTVLSQIASATSTSRTLPAFATTASASNSSNTTRGFQFLSSFNAPVTGELWYGNLERKRYVCSGSGPAALAPVDDTAGDRFMDNVNMDDAGRPRQFFTAVGETQGALIHSGRSIRPYYTTNADGLGTYASTPAQDDTLRAGQAFATHPPPAALAIDASTAAASCVSTLATSDPATCRERLLRYNVGESNGAYGIAETRDVSSCPSGKTCSEFGAIYHSTPSTIGPPRDFLRDVSYAEFAAQTGAVGTAGLRPVMLYTATIDGQVHAFKVSATDPNDPFQVTQKANNELWSFIPPAVLPKLLGTYNQQSILLDGATVVKDVVFTRTRSEALAGTAANGGASWSTVLVGGGGLAGGYYYALDVTDPETPKFLWQLSTDDSGSPLFGDTSSTPAIATVAMNGAGGDVEEVAVAILPGGAAPVQSGGCGRSTPAATLAGVDVNGVYVPRAKIRCWGAPGATTPGPARSLTIVRLDNGELLMNFRGAAADGPANIASDRQAIAPFDSPMTGVPVPYPAETGKVATRIYAGDADGTLWRVDLTNPEPAKWAAELAWDGYPEPAAYDASQPIDVAPVVSIDPAGNNVVLFSTGDQELFTASGSIETRVWSVTERTVALAGGGTGLASAANWQIPFTNGKRVTGPITLFDSVAYFATFTPTPVSPGVPSCEDGYAQVWGVHFTDSAPLNQSDPCPPDGSAAPPYPRQAFPDPQNPASLTYCYPSALPQGAVVFGVAIAQTPSCSTSAVVSDPYFGSHTSITSVAEGSYSIEIVTGRGGSASGGAVTNSLSIPLPTPTRTTKIDSWACILE
jgi:type IV pilus assembly protein PilY1